MKLDRAGLFKARPVEWSVFTADSGAVAINIQFRITAMYEGGEWQSWADYTEMIVYGAYWVVKKDKSINTGTVDQLAKSIGWNGDLRAVTTPVPDVEVQIAVKEDEYDGKTQYKAGWMNPGDYVPMPQTSEEDVSKLHGQFGSLLKAAAGAALEEQTKQKPPAGKKEEGDDLPF